VKVLKVIQIHAFRVKASSNIKGYAYAI